MSEVAAKKIKKEFDPKRVDQRSALFRKLRAAFEKEDQGVDTVVGERHELLHGKGYREIPPPPQEESFRAAEMRAKTEMRSDHHQSDKTSSGRVVEMDPTARGYARMIEHWGPRRCEQLYRAVNARKSIPCPEGFDDEARVAWEHFVTMIWYPTVSLQERAAWFEQTETRPQHEAHRQALVRRMHELKIQIKKQSGVSGALRGVFGKSADAHNRVHHDFDEVREDFRIMSAYVFVDRMLANVETKLDSHDAVFLARELFRAPDKWQDEPRAPIHASLREHALLALTGSYAPSLKADSQLAVAAAEQVLRSKPRELSEKTHMIDGRPFPVAGDWDEYVCILQTAIIQEISRALVDGQSLRFALSHEPLAGLVTSYRQSIDRTSRKDAQFMAELTTFCEEQLGEAEAEVRYRSPRAADARMFGKKHDARWVSDKLEEGSENRGQRHVPAEMINFGTNSGFGYFIYNHRGEPQFFYERQKNNPETDVWEFDDAGVIHFAGQYQSGRFFPYEERVWEYRSQNGTEEHVTEFQQNIYFTPSGSVVAVPKNAGARGTFQTTLLGSRAAFPEILNVKRGDTIEKITISGGEYLISPQNMVVRLHPLYGLTEIGLIQGKE